GDGGMTNVVIVDDHQLFRAGVRAELDGLVDVLGDASTVEDAVRLILEAEPDVAVLDVHMPGGGGPEGIRQVGERRPAPRFRPLGRAAPPRRLMDLASLAEEIRAHRGCGFEPCETATRMVPGEGSPTAAVMLVGEAPGATEDALGRPFVGRAGRLLDEALAEAGLARADVWITNVVKARPPRNRDPRAAEVAHWMPWLESEL